MTDNFSLVFSKDDTRALKGMAIILMLFHHTFVYSGMYEMYSVNFFPLNEEVINHFAWFGKLCVPIFAFLSAFGLSTSKEKGDKWICKRLLSLLKNYWIVYLLAIIITSLINNLFYSIFFEGGDIRIGLLNFLLDFLGLSGLLGTTSFNGSWWYISLAILVIIMVPVFVWSIGNFGAVATTIMVIFIPRIFGVSFQGNNGMLSFVFSILLGVLFSQLNLFSLFLKRYKSQIVNFSIFIVMTFLLYVIYQAYTWIPVENFYEINYGIMPVYVIVYAKRYLVSIPIIREVMIYLGKHSMNVFYVHIFIRSYYCEKFIYSFSNCFIVVLVLLIISLLISYFIERIKVLFSKVCGWARHMCKNCG